MLDHPIHPPSEFLSSSYGSGMPAPANYVIKSVDGVFHVFESDDAAQRGECLNYNYPVFKKYLDDVQRMCVMISDGPLYVDLHIFHLPSIWMMLLLLSLLLLQEIVLLPEIDVFIGQVSAARPPQRVEGTGAAEGRAPSRFLQHPKGRPLWHSKSLKIPKNCLKISQSYFKFLFKSIEIE